MPRLLIVDAHEWINEISTVPDCPLANSQTRERAWNNQRGGEGHSILIDSKAGEGSGIPGVVVKCVDIGRNTSGESGYLAHSCR